MAKTEWYPEDKKQHLSLLFLSFFLFFTVVFFFPHRCFMFSSILRLVVFCFVLFSSEQSQNAFLRFRLDIRKTSKIH